MGCHAPGFVLQLVVGAGSWRQSEIRWKKCIATRICCAGSWSYIILISFLYGIIIVSWSCKMYFLQSAWLQPQPKTSKSTSYKLCSVYIFQEEYQRSHMCLLFGYMIIYYIYIIYVRERQLRPDRCCQPNGHALYVFKRASGEGLQGAHSKSHHPSDSASSAMPMFPPPGMEGCGGCQHSGPAVLERINEFGRSE